jgi:hypothetical protein
MGGEKARGLSKGPAPIEKARIQPTKERFFREARGRFGNFPRVTGKTGALGIVFAMGDER